MSLSQATTKVQKALEALDRLDPSRADDRDDWLTVGMALHSVAPDDPDLLDAWVEWSQQSDKFNEGECEAQWAKFKREGGITLGTLMKLAREDEASGASPAAPPKPKPASALPQKGPPAPKPLPPVPTKPKGPPSLAKPPKLTPMAGTFTDAAGAITAAGRCIPNGVHVATWPYQNAAGDEIMQVARFNLPDGSKQFRPVHRVANGWKIGDPPGPLPLYRLNELPAAAAIYITEGEKACDAARSIGLPATTSAHGSSAAGKSDWTALAGRDVVILPDADKPGRQYARDVATILVRLDPPARVRIVELPGLPESGDVVEYIHAHPGQSAESIRAGIEALAGRTAVLCPDDLIGGPVLECLADVQPREVPYLWPGRIPLGRISLLVGRPGEGKSFLTTDMAARVTTGTPWPDGSACAAGSVILINAEDDPADTIRPRLDAHHADVSRVHLLSMVRRVGKNGKVNEVMFTLADVAALEAALKAHPDCKLIVIDPIGSFLGGGTDAHRDNEVRAVLAPVAKLAEKYGPVVLVVAHRRKGEGSHADDLALGSRAFTGIARATWHLSREKSNKARRLLLPGKNNNAPEGHGLAFTIACQPPRIIWERQPVEMTADEGLAAENGEAEKPGPEPDARNEAGEWLRAMLANGPVEAAKVKAEAKAAGLAWRTVQRAAESLGVVSKKEPSFGGGWQWTLPQPGTKDAKSACQDPQG